MAEERQGCLLDALEALEEMKAEMPEKRSFEEEMEALGVEVIKTRKPSQKPSQRKWYPPRRSGPKKTAGISVAQTVITVSAAVMKALGSDYAVPGIDVINGKNALLLMASEKGKGYKLSPCKTSSARRLTNVKLIARMVADGLEYGRYRAEKAKGGVIAWLVKKK